MGIDAAKKYAADRTGELLRTPVMRVSWEVLELELEKAYAAGSREGAERLQAENQTLRDQHTRMLKQGITLKQAEQAMRRQYVHVQSELRNLLGGMS